MVEIPANFSTKVKVTRSKIQKGDRVAGVTVSYALYRVPPLVAETMR